MSVTSRYQFVASSSRGRRNRWRDWKIRAWQNAVGFLMARIIPGLTDHEMPAIVQACADAGAQFAGYVMLRLPYAVKDALAVAEALSGEKRRVLGRLRDSAGKLNDPRFGRDATKDRWPMRSGTCFG